MEDEPFLSTDSFVDTVANTVGILIILTIMTIAMSGKEAARVDPQILKLQGLQASIAALKEKLPGIQERVSEKKGKIASALGLGAGGKFDVEEVKRRIGALQREVATAQENVRGIRGELSMLASREEGLRLRLDELNATDAWARGVLAAEELAAVEARDAREMERTTAAIKAEAAKLMEEARSDGRSLEELRASLAGLSRERKELEAAIAELSEKAEVSVNVKPPFPLAPGGEERRKTALWVECYVPIGADGSAGEASVRIIAADTFEKAATDEGDILRPRPGARGEPLSRVREDGGEFAKFLAGKDPSSHFLYCHVRPGAHSAFRAVRRLAERSGWEVQWEPAP